VRSRWVCGVPCPGGATERLAQTGSGIRHRIHTRSTHQPRGSRVAAFRRSRISICLVAVPSAGRRLPHGRRSPDPRSRLPDSVDTRSGSCRCRAAARQRLTDSSSLCPTAPVRPRAAPSGAQPNHRAPARSGRGVIRCQGSQDASSSKQNRFTLGWQAPFRISAESEYRLDFCQVGNAIRAMSDCDNLALVLRFKWGLCFWVGWTTFCSFFGRRAAGNRRWPTMNVVGTGRASSASRPRPEPATARVPCMSMVHALSWANSSRRICSASRRSLAMQACSISDNA
jgi:hypothetical protein